MLDAGSDLTWEVLCATFQPGRSSRTAAVRDDRDGGDIAVVTDHVMVAAGVLGTGLAKGLAVVAVAGKRRPDRDDQLRIGVDADLMVGRVPIVRAGGAAIERSRVRTSVPSTMSIVPGAKRLRGRKATFEPRSSMMRSAADFDMPNKGARCRKVGLVRLGWTNPE
jgi:hypothetical protein